MSISGIDYDLEFAEDGRTIELISIALKDAAGGGEYYAINGELAENSRRGRNLRRRLRRDGWLMENVVSQLPRVSGGQWENDPASRGWLFNYRDRAVKPRNVIADEVRDFILAAGPDVALWADYGAYDHVALCQLWGTMMDLPNGVPMFTHDIQQEIRRLGVSSEQLPKQAQGMHNALEDARHQQRVRRWLAEQEQARVQPLP